LDYINMLYNPLLFFLIYLHEYFPYLIYFISNDIMLFMFSICNINISIFSQSNWILLAVSHAIYIHVSPEIISEWYLLYVKRYKQIDILGKNLNISIIPDWIAWILQRTLYELFISMCPNIFRFIPILFLFL
jgi:hypothetical protein